MPENIKPFTDILAEILKCRFLKEIKDKESDLQPYESTNIRYMLFLLFLSKHSTELYQVLDDLNEFEYIYKKLVESIKLEI